MNGATRSRLVAVVAVPALLIGAGAVVAANWTPTVPSTAASTPIARTTVSGPVDPDPDPETDLSLISLSPMGQACLDRVTRPEGWLDLCWAVQREPDLDATNDYFRLRLYGTVSGDGSGIRWSRVRADLAGAPSDGVFEGWPEGVIDGACGSANPDNGNLASTTSLAQSCGRTVGVAVGVWGYSSTWTCVGCVLPDHGEHEVALTEHVKLLHGAVPEWSIGADFGS